MNSCPVCDKTFPDEYSFCLSDGTPLAGGGTLSEEATVVKERPAAKKSSGRSILVFVLAALLSLSLGAMAAILYFFWPSERASDPPIASVSPSPASPETPSPTPQRTTPRPSPSQRETANKQQSDDDDGDDDQPDPPPPPDASDPGPTRISFRRGRAHETVSGRVSESRSFVLSARDGQTLSARVTSPGDCVGFANGDQAFRRMTAAGNNSLTILNSCDGPSRFTLTVGIR